MERPARLQMWVEEIVADLSAQKFRVVETLFTGQSDYQRVDVLKTKGFGVMLFLDGVVMLSERDEFIYHDMISHVPMYVHPNPRSVLVIGGGDGGTVREVLRHPEVVRCKMVEIDGLVVEVSKKFIHQTSCAFEDPRLDLTIGDGVKFMAETEERFDLVIVDSTDPIGPAKPLFGPEFYGNVARVLTEDGIVVSQGESPYYEVEAQKAILASMGCNFPVVHMYNYANLTYPCGLWSFIYASKGLCPLSDFDEARYRRQALDFSYYNADIHRGAFALPQFQRNSHGKYLSPFKKKG